MSALFEFLQILNQPVFYWIISQHANLQFRNKKCHKLSKYRWRKRNLINLKYGLIFFLNYFYNIFNKIKVAFFHDFFFFFFYKVISFFQHWYDFLSAFVTDTNIRLLLSQWVWTPTPRLVIFSFLFQYWYNFLL